MQLLQNFKKAVGVGYNFIEDGMVVLFHITKLFELDAYIERSYASGMYARSRVFADKWGVSNRAFLERSNRRYPDNPLPNPYAQNPR